MIYVDTWQEASTMRIRNQWNKIVYNLDRIEKKTGKGYRVVYCFKRGKYGIQKSKKILGEYGIKPKYTIHELKAYVDCLWYMIKDKKNIN